MFNKKKVIHCLDISLKSWLNISKTNHILDNNDPSYNIYNCFTLFSMRRGADSDATKEVYTNYMFQAMIY